MTPRYRKRAIEFIDVAKRRNHYLDISKRMAQSGQRKDEVKLANIILQQLISDKFTVYLREQCAVCSANQDHWITCQQCVQASEMYLIQRGHSVVVPSTKPVMDVVVHETETDHEEYELQE